MPRQLSVAADVGGRELFRGIQRFGSGKVCFHQNASVPVNTQRLSDKAGLNMIFGWECQCNFVWVVFVLVSPPSLAGHILLKHPLENPKECG